MDYSPFWIAVLGGIGTSAWAVFTETGRRLMAWLWRPFAVRLAKRRERLEGLSAMPAMLSEVRDEVGSIKTARDAESLRITGQYQALNDTLDSHTRILEGQNKVMAQHGEALATTLSITRADFDASPVATFVCDDDGNNILVNDAFAELLGMDQKDLMQKRWQGVIHPADLSAHLRRRNAAQDGHYQFDDDIRMVPRGSPILRVRVHLRPHPPDVGPASRWVGTVTSLGAAA